MTTWPKHVTGPDLFSSDDLAKKQHRLQWTEGKRKWPVDDKKKTTAFSNLCRPAWVVYANRRLSLILDKNSCVLALLLFIKHFSPLIPNDRVRLSLIETTNSINPKSFFKVKTAFTRLKAPVFILNLASWTRCLFDTRSLLELFIHEAVVFVH